MIESQIYLNFKSSIISRRLNKKYDSFNITTLINKMKRKKIKEKIIIFIPIFIFFMLAIFFKYFLYMKFNKNKMSKRKLKRIKIKFIKKKSFKNKYKNFKSIINFI